MATEYSLLTWAGLGTAVTLSTSTHLVTFAAHGAPVGHAFRFAPETTTMPIIQGVQATVNDVFYVASDSYAAGAFRISAAADGSIPLTITNAGSGVKVVGNYWASLPATDPGNGGNYRGRYGTVGSERVYATLSSFNTTLLATIDYSIDVVLEVEGRWREVITSAALSFKRRKSIRIHSKIAGTRSSAFHSKRFGGGYVFEQEYQWNGAISLDQPECEIDGLEIRMNSTANSLTSPGLAVTSTRAKVTNNLLMYGTGMYLLEKAADCSIYNNIIANGYCGINIDNLIGGSIYNNLVYNNTFGFRMHAAGQWGYFRGLLAHNLAINNGQNYPPFNREWSELENGYFYNNFGDANDLKTVGFNNTTNTVLLTAHGLTKNTPVRLFNGGGAVAPTGLALGSLYYVRTVTSADAFTLTTALGGTTDVDFTNDGAGTIQISRIWDNSRGAASTIGGYLTTADFVDISNADSSLRDYSPSIITSPQVNKVALDAGDGFTRADIMDAIRPNYNPDTTPWNATAGPIEFDTGHGLTPNYQNFTITGLISGSRVKIKKTSDGTVIHNDIVNATSLTISYNAGTAPTPVTIDIAKGNAAPFYYRYRTTASISHLGASGVSVAQIPDIARGATYPAGVATDWAVNTGTNAISNTNGSTVYTVQVLYSWLCDYYDHVDRVDLDMPMYGVTAEIFGLQNGGIISDAHMQKLKGGSIKDGTTLWANVYTVGSQAASTPIYVHVNGVLYTSFWPAGNIDVLLKMPDWAGTEVVDVRAHNYSDTYDHWSMTISGEGRNVAAISTVDDPDNQTAAATVAGWNDITVTANNPTGKQIDASDTPADYTTTIDGGGRPVAEVYERLKWLTKAESTYVSANAAFPEVKASPYGTLAGGVFLGAQGIWLQNIASGDLLKYVLTDNAGGQHQAAAPLGYQSVTISGGTAGTRLQIYDVTSSTELYNGIPSVWPHVWEDTSPWAADRGIRIRAAYVDGVTAKEFIEANIGTCTQAVPAVTYLLSQKDDAVYISNAIDGSAVTGVTFTDASTDLININIPSATVNLKTIYAAFVYWMSTEIGIADDIAYIEAKDGANYVFTQMKIKNISSPAVATKVTGGYFWDATSGDIADCIDLTGGNVFPVPTHVVEKIITVSGVNVITGDIADIPAGGLTTGEHDQLMATLTESAFIGLK